VKSSGGFISDRLASALLITAALGGILITILMLGEQNRADLVRLRQQIETLGTAHESLRNGITDALRRQSVTASAALQHDVVLTIEGAPFKGDANAPVTIVAFIDFESPDCARYARETLPQLERGYISAGKLKYVFRSFPDEATHAAAFRAHEAAECAGEQGKFWQMHDRLFATRAKLDPAEMAGYAKAIGVDREKFLTCFDGGLHAPAIRRDILEGQKNGVSSTPTFFLGRSAANGATLKPLRMIKGAQPYSEFKEAIDALLSD
jgi:protein-disulfide isomerase